MTIDAKTPAPVGADLVQALDDLTTAAGMSTQRNKQLPAVLSVPSIPVRIGRAQSDGAPV